MKYKLKFNLLPNEAWYGADINYGYKLPVTENSRAKTDTRYIDSCNQATPLWVSNKGRYIWSNAGYLVKWNKGTAVCCSEKSEIRLYDGYKNLRGAYLAASKAHFPFDGKLPDEMMFRTPQYCTWIHLATNQNEEDIIDFAKGILDSGMTAGELIIDDGWQTDFGEWEFHPDKFKNPKRMIDELHQMGFKVILWICPFVAPTVKDYSFMIENRMLVRNCFGKTAYRTWWNGKHPVLDLSNPKSVEWFKATADRLMNEYGVDGFKQDAGDAYFYKDSDRTFRPGTDANAQSYLWAETAREYEFNELRACFKGGGWGVTQRLADKTHSWDRNGLNTLIPNALLQGLSGYPYSCPDMIGGGEISSFKRKNGDTFSIDKAENEFDTELLIRWCQCSALMPMMQYSFAIWKMENDTAREVCISCAELHQKYADTILSLAQNASKTGEPIIRSLEYQYPNQGYEKVNDMFMLGESILVSPVLKKGDRQKTLRLPNGKWRYVPDKKEYIGGEIITVDAPLDVLPIFEKTAD